MLAGVFLVLFSAQGFLVGVLGLRLRGVSVPAVVIRGEAVWLNCSYDLENDVLYSVKWHKDDVEFYRYLPADKPPSQAYPLPGIHLDPRHTSRGNLYMPYTDVASEGSYRCEVSTEAPTFQTVKGERQMRIYVNPSSRPWVVGTKPHYAPGEVVNVTCVSAPSRPAAFLKWWINGQEAGTDQLIRSIPMELSEAGLFESRLVLRFSARPHHFFLGRMRLQCEAIISQAHTLRSEEIIISDGGTTMATGAYDQQRDGPSIVGGKHAYSVGDLVDINCTSAKSQPPAELHWYINDKEVRSESLVYLPPVVYPNGQESRVLGLRFEVKQRHFVRREMRLRCTATLSEVSRMTSEPLEAVMDAQRHKSDLHVDINTGTVSSLSTWNPLDVFPVWAVLLSLTLRSLL